MRFTESMDKFVIIVAGGSGTRMGAAMPKQFIRIGGKAILVRTVEAFRKAYDDISIVLVLPESHFDMWRECAHEVNLDVRGIALVSGGETRFHSVKHGLDYILSLGKSEALIGVHDGVRPFASVETITSAYSTALNLGTAIPALDCVDSVRLTDGASNHAIDRRSVRLIQTPQVFTQTILRQAYEQEYTDTFTDDASVVERMGRSVDLTPGNRENIKITTPFDLTIAEAFLSSEK